MRLLLDEGIKKIPAYPKSFSYGFEGNLIRLASNESPYPPSPNVISGLIESLFHLNRYPDGETDLKISIADYLNLEPEDIILGCGSNEIIETVLKVARREGRQKVIVPYPSFAFYKIASMIYGYEVIEVPLRDFRIDIDGILERIDNQTRIVFLCNPNNPTGKIMTKSEFEYLLRNLQDHIILVVDEAYSEFVESEEFPLSYAYIREYPIVTLRTFSKAFSLAGLRVGFGIAHPEMVKVLERARQPFSVNMLALIAARRALEDRVYMENQVKRILAEKKRICEKLKEKGVEFIPSETNFLLIKLGDEAEGIVRRLYEEGILIRWMGPMGLPEYVRVTVGKREENEIFISTLFRLLGVE